MIFNEIYGAYYNAVAKIIEKAIDHPLKEKEIRTIVEDTAFTESVDFIEKAFYEERWQILIKDEETKTSTTSLTQEPTMPLSTLQKRWMKAVWQDPRIKLFGEKFEGLEDVKPLFTPEDMVVFDKYDDGDPYENEEYIKNFRLILSAIRNKNPLQVTTRGKKGNELSFVIMPKHLEYSEKDDKFRLICSSDGYGNTLNLARILKCELFEGKYTLKENVHKQQNLNKVVIELTNERNALERVLLHFAHFEKQAEKIDDMHYKIIIVYDAGDQREMLIRILSFGPMIRVTGPDDFITLIKDRLKRQKDCGC